MVKSLILMIVLISFLVSCTTPNVRDTSSINHPTKNCDDVDYVIKLMDTLPQGNDSSRYPFMETSPYPNLQELKEDSRMTVEIINPLFLLFGYAYITTPPLGGISHCDVRYIPGFNWLFLKHELSHCRGYADGGIPIMIAEYTDEQKAIMGKGC
jgi:hypothetical protein